MGKLCAILAGLGLAVVFAACGDDDDAAGTPTTAPTSLATNLEAADGVDDPTDAGS